MSSRMRLNSMALLLNLVLLGTVVSIAAAAPPLNVHIEVPEQIGASGEAFTATGAAVTSGLVCASGTVDDLSVVTHGSTDGAFRTLLVHKRFYCADATGTFDVKLVVHLDNASLYTTATWKFAGGTGAYAGLHGHGSLAGTPIIPGFSIYDVYDGQAF